ncbi:MAG TPA: cytochrome C oxidase subunit IV family protein [Burkholderiaceae bacterium]
MADERAAPSRFIRERRRLALSWIALLLLMLTSLGSAWLKLGPWNMVAGLVIAGIKAAIVAWLFMRLREAGVLIRLAAVAGLGAWCLLVALSGVDYATRTLTPTPVQRPQQLLPVQAASEPR